MNALYVLVQHGAVIFGPVSWDNRQAIAEYIAEVFSIGLFFGETYTGWEEADLGLRVLPYRVADPMSDRTHTPIGHSDDVGETEVVRNFTYELVDIDALRAELVKTDKAVCNTKLSDTDWYYTRKAETGDEVPDDVKQMRAAVRQAQKDREEWILTAPVERLGDLDGLPTWPGAAVDPDAPAGNTDPISPPVTDSPDETPSDQPTADEPAVEPEAPPSEE